MKRVLARHRRLLFCAVVLMVIPLVCAAAIVIDGLTDDIGQSDVAIVPGNTVYADGTPSRRLVARLDRARELYAKGLVKAVIVSGGQGSEGYDEATAMKAWLIGHGVPAAAVIGASPASPRGAGLAVIGALAIIPTLTGSSCGRPQ